MVVGAPQVPVRPCASNRSPTPANRAPRFITQLPLTFRLSDGGEWRHGFSENISRSGILFQTGRNAMGLRWDDSAACGTRVDVLFEVPTEASSRRKRHIECEGRLVRMRGTGAPGTRVSIGVAVLSYAVVPASSETSPARAAVGSRTDARLPVPGKAATDVLSSRRSSRVAIGLQRPVTAEVTSSRSGQTGVAGRIASLSPTGAFLELAADYPIGCSLNLFFRLPPLFTSIGCSAVVRSHRWGRGIGVEFVDLAQHDCEQIKKFVAGLARSS
jgi:hypothetical protein